jgi:hypothetical protein
MGTFSLTLAVAGSAASAVSSPSTVAANSVTNRLGQGDRSPRRAVDDPAVPASAAGATPRSAFRAEGASTSPTPAHVG